MLISKTAKVKWNSRNKKYYVNLGYEFNGMGNEFNVNVEHLTQGSNAKVYVKCDYCNSIYEIMWQKYIRSCKSEVNKDCCSNPSCTGKKASESLINKYGTRNIFEVPEIKEKLITTNIERYGCENPFANDEIKVKIRKSNMEKYGCEYSMQNPDVVKKGQQTCLEKYGVINYGAIYSKEHSKEKSSHWKGGTEYSGVERATMEYRHWRRNVLERDMFTCQCCGANNKSIELQVHHIFDWVNYEDRRYDVENGITFCEPCHILFHSIYGKHGNNDIQLQEFLNNKDKKIC